MLNSEPSWLDYTQVAPANWAQSLAEANRQSPDGVSIPIYWGAHESLCGIRDFAKASRLRIEKLLNLAAQSQIKLKIHLGFFAHEKTFPDWTRGLPDKTTIPESGWLDAIGLLRKVEVPSLLNEACLDGFLGFLDELLAILNLYRSPEGPIVQIRVHSGIYDLDLSLVEQTRFRRTFAERYPDIQGLNQKFQTTFKTQDDATSKMGLRTLSEKRPWLAAHDYRWCRQRCLDTFFTQVEAVFVRRGVSHLFRRNSHGDVTANENGYEILFEDTLVETLGSRALYPRSLSGLTNPMSTLAFRMAEHIQYAANHAGVAFSYLEAARTSARRHFCFIGGRYLSRAAQKKVVERLEQESLLFFPFGLPQFNEDLEPLVWNAREKVRLKIEDREFIWAKTPAGRILLPTEEFQLTAPLFPRMDQTMEQLQRWTHLS